MKKGIFFFLIIVIGFCLICGCTSHSQSPKTQFNVNESASDGILRVTVIQSNDTYIEIPPIPYFSYEVKQERRMGIKNIVLTLENLKSDRVIHISSTDFRLVDATPSEHSYGYFVGGVMAGGVLLSTDFRLVDPIENSDGHFVGEEGTYIKFDLQPDQREQVAITYVFVDNDNEYIHSADLWLSDPSHYKRLKFDFSGPSGNTGSQIVYFNL
jgi:hypothetical protein